jgi:excisionase family DNA binding protein
MELDKTSSAVNLYQQSCTWWWTVWESRPNARRLISGNRLRKGQTMPESRKPVVSERATGAIFGPSAQPLLNSNQAAQFLGVHPRTLQRMVRRGEINGVRVGKLWRFVPSSIRDWVQDHNIAS